MHRMGNNPPLRTCCLRNIYFTPLQTTTFGVMGAKCIPCRPARGIEIVYEKVRFSFPRHQSARKMIDHITGLYTGVRTSLNSVLLLPQTLQWQQLTRSRELCVPSVLRWRIIGPQPCNLKFSAVDRVFFSISTRWSTCYSLLPAITYAPNVSYVWKIASFKCSELVFPVQHPLQTREYYQAMRHMLTISDQKVYRQRQRGADSSSSTIHTRKTYNPSRSPAGAAPGLYASKRAKTTTSHTGSTIGGAAIVKYLQRTFPLHFAVWRTEN